MKTSSSAIPNDHSGCAGEVACLRCKAYGNLTREDFDIVDFYGKVQDQSVNLTPFGAGEGRPAIVSPRLEGWLAACELYGVPVDVRAGLVDDARFLFEAVHERVFVPGVHAIPSGELEPPAEPS